MSFAYHDVFWTNVADFVGSRARPGETILAPDLFWWKFPKIHRYANLFLRPDVDYDWAIIHKGELGQLPRAALDRISAHRAVFANDVFVVFHQGGRFPPLAGTDVHYQAFFDRLKERLAQVEPAYNPRHGEILPDPGSITNFVHLSDGERREAMNAFWSNGGYVYESERDMVYHRELMRHLRESIGATAGRDILDLCCGTGVLAPIAPDARVVGIDFSDAVIDLARKRNAERGNFQFLQMDAHDLKFPDRSFDDVVWIEGFEHVRDPRQVLMEIARVMRDDGRLILSSANSDSVNQILTRKLGHPSFLTNYQHIAEVSYPELVTLLTETGFTVERASGLFLFPYWGIPGVDGAVRNVTDHDVEFVELMRELGERIGPRHAYASFVLARRLPRP